MNRFIHLLTVVAVVVGLAVRPDLAGLPDQDDARLVGDSYDGYDTVRSAPSEAQPGSGRPQAPLHQAFDADEDNSGRWQKKVEDQVQAWTNAVSGLDSYPGTPQGANKIYDRIDLLPWIYQTWGRGINLTTA